MATKEIKLNGRTYSVVFNMKTVIEYEEKMGHSFFEEKAFSTFKARIALIVAAIVAANNKDEITFEELEKIDTLEGMNEIVKAFTVVMELSTAFFHISSVEQQDEKKGKESKNA